MTDIIAIPRRHREKRIRLAVGPDPSLGLAKNATWPLHQEQEAERVGIGAEVTFKLNHVLKFTDL